MFEAFFAPSDEDVDAAVAAQTSFKGPGATGWTPGLAGAALLEAEGAKGWCGRAERPEAKAARGRAALEVGQSGGAGGALGQRRCARGDGGGRRERHWPDRRSSEGRWPPDLARGKAKAASRVRRAELWGQSGQRHEQASASNNVL
ncbi:hypothetical protein ABZP36_006128 [Zizania latifolia]